MEGAVIHLEFRLRVADVKIQKTRKTAFGRTRIHDVSPRDAAAQPPFRALGVDDKPSPLNRVLFTASSGIVPPSFIPWKVTEAAAGDPLLRGSIRQRFIPDFVGDFRKIASTFLPISKPSPLFNSIRHAEDSATEAISSQRTANSFLP